MPTAIDTAWHPGSWQDREARQQPDYPDAAALEDALARLRALPPLVTSWEIHTLQDQLAEAAAGRRFLLQGGDCAERFDECGGDRIVAKLKILLQMSLVLVYGLKRPVVRVGRLAGQYAKPRSSPDETRDGVTLPSYRGDIVNGPDFTASDRTPDPERLLQAYAHAGLTLNFVRALVDAGFADLHHPEYWDLDFARHSPHADEYRAIVDHIRDALGFMDAVAATPVRGLERAEFFTSHEALHLHYEEALTRRVPRRDGFYNLSTHLPWIGMRTAQPDGAHVEYMRGLRNPVAVKVGPGMTSEWLRDLVDRLDPDAVPGRLTLIHRLGADGIETHLPPLIDAIRRTGRTVLWCCDPMHGNTETTDSGIKTRHFDRVLSELEQAFAIHAAENSHLGGVHFELTGDDVTECVGGARGLTEADLERAYTSRVDPRLNAEQALEMALDIVHQRRSV